MNNRVNITQETLLNLCNLTTKELLKCFEQYKEQSNIKKIDAIYNLIEIKLSRFNGRGYSTDYVEMEKQLRSFEGKNKSGYHINLWVSRFLNWK